MAGVALIGIPSGLGAILGVLIFGANPLWSYLVIGVMLIISGINLFAKDHERPPAKITKCARS